MKKLLSKIAQRLRPALRIGLTCFALLALVGAGASAAMRVYQASDKDADTSSMAEQTALGINPADIPPDAKRMHPGGGPISEPAAVLAQLISVGGLIHDQAKARPRFTSDGDRRQDCHFACESRPVVRVSEVDGDLARTFTLVGAKPDGTS